MIKILNCYAGIGGNRKLWYYDNIEIKITAVEKNPNIARIYKDYFPEDDIIIDDAHLFLLNHFSEFDFIWSSPPCQTHSRLRRLTNSATYPDLTLYQEIILLKYWFKGLWIVENVVPYYKPLIEPTMKLHRHFLWCNFDIEYREFEKLGTCKVLKEREFLQKKFGYDLSNYKGIDKREVLRNCVVPEMGKHILDNALKILKGEK